MKYIPKTLAIAMGTMLVGSANQDVNADTSVSPFSMSAASASNMLAGDADENGGDKESEGNCGNADEPEVNCGGDKGPEGNCGGDEDSEGACGGDKDSEGKCGEGRCGG